MLLLHRWARADAGDSEVVVISGEPGIGKSRVQRWRAAGSTLQRNYLAIGKGEAFGLQSDDIDEQCGKEFGPRLRQIRQRFVAKRPGDGAGAGEQACRTWRVEKEADLADQRMSPKYSHAQRR